MHHQAYSPQQHIHHHYHYHYHYDLSQHQAPPNPSRKTSEKLSRRLFPRTYSSSIQDNYWKKHLNPQVERLYRTIHPKQSRLSENNRISEEDSFIEEASPTTSKKKLLETQCGQDTTNVQSRPLSKLQSLYYSKQKGKLTQEVQSIASDPQEAFFSVHQQKLRGYKRQIERLKRIQEQCLYLREHFMLHVESKHPQFSSKP